MSSKTETKKPSYLWWLIGVFLLLLFMMVQLPAAWLIQKFMPNQTYIETVNGNLWKGQMQWQLPSKYTQSNKPITGNLSWKWRAWEILWLNFGADIKVKSSGSKLVGRLGVSKTTWAVSDLTGKLSADFLKQTVPMQWPNTDVNLQKINLKNTYKGKQKDWLVANGNLTWAGGELAYINQGKSHKANLPALLATLSLEDKKLHIAMTNTKEERMGDIFLDADSMVDVQLTQRLLLNVDGYKGNAAPDTAVVSVRQPLSTLGK